MSNYYDYSERLEGMVDRDFLLMIEKNLLEKAYSKVEQYEMGLINSKDCKEDLDSLINAALTTNADRWGHRQVEREATMLMDKFNHVKEVMER